MQSTRRLSRSCRDMRHIATGSSTGPSRDPRPRRPQPRQHQRLEWRQAQDEPATPCPRRVGQAQTRRGETQPERGAADADKQIWKSAVESSQWQRGGPESRYWARSFPKAAFAARRVASMSAAEWASERKAASNWEGARFTPPSSIALKKRAYRSVSAARAVW